MSLLIENVSKTFEDEERPTIHNINLEIKKGEFICVIGKSGCGKSTLLNLIAGLDKPTKGKITLDEKEITSPSRERVVMFQENALFPWLNTIENVKFGLNLAGVSKEEQESTAMKYLSMVGLEKYRDYPIHQLSGGMRQRVALARAFTMDSKILLMDEPFSALDKQTSNTLRRELESLWMKTNRTVFFITHSVEEAVFLADRVVVMSSKTGTIHEIIEISLERPRDVYSESFVAIRHKILDFLQGGES